MRIFRLGLLSFCLFFSLGSQAQQPFRAALSGRFISGCNFLPMSEVRLEWLGPDRLEDPTNVRQIASGVDDQVLALLFGPGLTIVRIQPSGTQTPFYQDPAATAEVFTVGRDGRVYVPLHNGVSFVLAVISPAGVLEATHPIALPQHPTDVAIADDGCTLFILENFGSTFRRFNACAGGFLPDIFPGLQANDVQPLPGGQVLLAQERNVNLYDANGVFIRTVASLPSYGLNDVLVGQIATLRTSADLWIHTSACDSTGVLLRVSLENGTLISRRDTSLNTPNALVIGSVNAATSDVPLGPNALLLLAVSLAAVAVLRL